MDSILLQNYDTLSKSKKSWSVRLGLSRQGGHMSEDGSKQGWGTISGGSALSRQMRYGDPWLYGTVRGQRHQNINDPRSTGQGYGGPPPGAPILVVCSCPEFLSGTTRRLGNCKKCGGHRLAGLPLGGTCRAPSTSSRLRPSLAGVLRPALDDPYDLVRRSRLVEPRSRARSISPHRQGGTPRDGRSQSVAWSVKETDGRSNLPRSDWFSSDSNFSGKINRHGDDWLKEETREEKHATQRRSDQIRTVVSKRPRNLKRDIDPRKSILECDVNPYLLVKKQLRDEDDFSDDLSDNALELDEPLPTLFDPSKVKSIERIPARCSVAAIGGQRIRVFNEPREVSEREEEVEEEASSRAKEREREREVLLEEERRMKSRERERENRERAKGDEEEDDNGEEERGDESGGVSLLTTPTSIPIPKVSPKRPPRKPKTDLKTATAPVKSILKKLKSAKPPGKKKSVLFNIENVIFAPVKTDFGPPRHGERSTPTGETPEVRTEVVSSVEKIQNRPKFITIPNIKDPKPAVEKVGNRSQAQPVNLEKPPTIPFRSGIPKSIAKTETPIQPERPQKQIEPPSPPPRNELPEPVKTEPEFCPVIRPEDETELEIEIEELEEPLEQTKLDHEEPPSTEENGKQI